MKVLLINGSPNEKGCTYTALCEIEKSLQQEKIETEIFQIGKKAIRGCMACGKCNGRCIFNDDSVNEAIEKIEEADGIVLGSPVYYASINGGFSAFLDRVFYASGGFPFKVGTSIVSARRAGTTASIDQLNKYFTISNMPLVSSQYWNMVHGNTPEEVLQDAEGLQTMRVLGRNMAWMLKCIEAGRAAGVHPPQMEERQMTNFIR